MVVRSDMDGLDSIYPGPKRYVISVARSKIYLHLFYYIYIYLISILGLYIKPVIGIQRVYCMRERRRVMTHEVPMLISSLGCVLLLLLLILLVLLILLNLLYQNYESLQKLHLRCDELIHSGVGWWWWQLLTTLVLAVLKLTIQLPRLVIQPTGWA
jgi:hypothetical protein